ncbi:hypothetical protein [Actinoallomurus sp. NPDC050550]|uniref:hypothetical protein n=1 Tax=Actinoallomurus sp. NPDC050550 TaxID=3154937 RepID=UPI0033CDDF62
MRCGDRGRANRVATGAGQVLGAVLIGAGLAEAVLLRRPGGLRLSLVGWFISWASAREGQAEVFRESVKGLCVGDVMRPEPPCTLAWRPVREFVATKARTVRFSTAGSGARLSPAPNTRLCRPAHRAESPESRSHAALPPAAGAP